MFTVGMDSDSKLYFSIATCVIAVPTALKIFNWQQSLLGNLIQVDTCVNRSDESDGTLFQLPRDP